MAEDNSKLKQKIWMMAAIIAPFKAAKGVAGSNEIAEAEIAIKAAQDHFRADELQQAREKADAAFGTLEKCAKKLPLTARMLLKPQLKKISKY